MLGIPWTEHSSNDETETQRTLSIGNKCLAFLGHTMKKRDFENLTVTGHSSGKRQTQATCQLLNGLV